MKKIIISIAIVLIYGSGMMAQVHLPVLNDSPTGIEIKKSLTLKHDVYYPAESADFQWYSLPSPTQDEVTQASIACDGSEMVIHYRKPRPSLNIDEGIVEKWAGNSWAVQTNVSNQCHEPDVDIDGSVVVATWYDDGYDYGYGTNVNGPWVSMTGTYLVKQWFPRAAMAMGLPYMSFASKYSDGMATSYDMLHIRSIVGVGEQIELNGGWRVTYTSVGLRTDITGDEDAWYCVFSQQQFLYVMKGAIVNSAKEYSDLGDGFRMYNPVSNPEIVLYKGNPVVAWLENANMELYIAEWDGSEWWVIGAGSVTTGNLYSLRMAASSSNLFVTYASTESDTAISVNLYDGETWYGMPMVQNYLNSNIGTVDIAVHNEEPVVAFTENKLLTIKKFTSSTITNTDQAITSPVSLTCFPNPTHDMITVQTKESGRYSMEIYSITGQIIHRQDFTGKTQQVDLTAYQKGIYFITVEAEAGVTTRRIIKL
jgi:hypothetical protein